MSSIDERVVRMEFDNEQFEAGVRTTLGTLEKLKEGLVFKKSAFNNLQTSANKVDFSGLNDGVYQVQQNFSLFGEFVRTLYDRIANWSINLGKTIVSALTLDPVRQGFAEYQMQMDAIQTIMANTKKEFSDLSEEAHLGVVNDALDELNRYADLTIYNFSQMTRNIGTFTAAGVGLEDSVSAIEGIANLAAVSGADSTQASRAMYQLSQALASGTVRLMDWRSVENANLGGQFFRDALRATAEEFLATDRQVESATGEMISYRQAAGITTSTIEELIEKNGSFRNSLQAGWVTSDVLLETLAKLTDVGLADYFADVTGADEEWILSQLEAIYATEDREEATQELAKTLAETGQISEETAKEYIDQMFLAQDAATKVKTLKQLIDTLKESMGSGWAMSFRLIAGDFKEALEMWTAVKDELTSILDESAKTRNAILQIWHDSTAVGSGGRVDALQAIADMYFGIKTAVLSVKEAFEDVFGSPTIEESAAKLMELTRGFSRFAGSFREFLESDEFTSRLQGIFGGLFTVAKAFLDVISNLLSKLSPLADGISQFAWYVFSAADSFSRLITYFVEADDKFAFLKNLFTEGTDGSRRFHRMMIELGLALDSLVGSVLKLIGVDIDGNPITEFVSSLSEFITSHVDLSVFDGLISKLPSVTDLFSALSSAASIAVNGFSSAIDAIGRFAGASLDKILDFFNGLAQMSSAEFSIGFFDAIGSTFDVFGPKFGEFFNSLSAIAPRFGEMIRSILSYFASSEFSDIANNIATLSSAGLLASLGSFVDAFREINFPTADNGKSIFGLIGEMLGSMLGVDEWVNAFKDLKKNIVDAINSLSDAFEHMQMVVNSNAILKIAIAVALLAHSLAVLSDVDPERMANGIAGITFMFVELMTAFNVLGASMGAVKPLAMSSAATAMIKMAIAVGIMAHAVVLMSSLSLEEVGVGLVGIAGLLLAMGLTARLMGSVKNSLNVSALGVLALSVAIRILAGGIMQLSGLSWDEMFRGLVGVAGLLAAVAGFAVAINGIRISLSSVMVVLAVSVAVNMLIQAVRVLGRLDEGILMQGVYSVAALVAILGGFMVAIGNASSTLRNVIALAVLVASIKILADVVKDLGSADFDVGTGLTGIVGIAIALDLVMAVLGSVKVPLKNMLAMVVATASLKILFAAFTELCTGGGSIVSGMAGLIAAVGSLASLMMLMDGLSVSVQNVVALIAVAMALKIVSDVIANIGEMPVASLIQGLLGLVGAMAIIGVSSVLLAKFTPAIIAASTAIGIFSLKLLLLSSAFMALGVALATIVASISISGFFDSLSDALSSFFDVLTNASFFTMLGTLAVGLQALVQALIVGFVMGILEGAVTILNGLGTLLEALGVAIHAIGDFLLANAPYVLGVVGNLILSVLGLISSMAPAFVATIGTFILVFLQIIATWLPTIADALVVAVVTLINSVAEGIRTHGPEILSAVMNIVSSIIELVLFGIEELLRLIPGVGDFLGDHLEAARGALSEAFSSADIEQAASDAMAGAQQGILNSSGTATDTASQAGQDIQSGLEEGLGDGSELSTEYMSEFMSGMTLDGYDVSGFSGSLSDTLSLDLTGAANNSVSSYTSAFSVDASQLPVASLPTDVVSMLGSHDSEFTNTGTQSITNYTNSLGSPAAMSNASSNGSRVASSGASGAGSRRSQYHTAGYNAGIGFGDGISSASGYVNQKAAQVATAARMTIDRTLEIASPSRVMMRSGRFVGEGLGLGIGQLVPYVESQSSKLGQGAIDGLRDTISHIGDLINSDIDVEPTIRPVLDLSEIQNGASAISGMIGSGARTFTAGFGVSSYALNNVPYTPGGRVFGSTGTNYSVYIDGARVNDIPAIQNATYDLLVTLQRYGDM